MPDRRPYVAANWKMYMTAAEAVAFLDAFLPEAESCLEDVDVVICAPYLALPATVETCRGKRVGVAAQNMHQEEQGAYTGEVSALMLLEAGVGAVVLGHSERRTHFGETDEALAHKVPVALDHGLQPILCVGETEAQRDAGEAEVVLRRQVEADLAMIDSDRLNSVVIAYEPIWAIGTGRTATSEQAQEAVAFIRAVLAERDAGVAERVRILYGGSVKPDNATELIAQPDVDGFLVGGASLDPGDFLAIVAAAAETG